MTSRSCGWELVPDKIKAINRVLRGWGNYYKHVSSSKTRNKLDWFVSQRMLRWLCKRHKNAGKRVILRRYYIRQGIRKNWGCEDEQEKVYLFMLRDIQHSNYWRKKPDNPYTNDDAFLHHEVDNPHIETWDGTTNRQEANWRLARAQALIRDNYCCTQCGSTSELEVHHIKPSGGKGLDNLQTLCQKCHQETPSYGRNRKPSQNG